MLVQDPLLSAPHAEPERDLLAILADIGLRLMHSPDAATLLQVALEGLDGLIALDQAWLEVEQPDSAAPLVLRLHAGTVERLQGSGVLTDPESLRIPLLAGSQELGRLHALPAKTLSGDAVHAVQILAGLIGMTLRLMQQDVSLRGVSDSAGPRRSAATTEPPRTPMTRIAGARADLSQLLSAQLGISILCDRVLERLLAVLSVEAGAMFVYETRTGGLQRMAQRGVPGPLPALIDIDRSAPAILGRTTAEGQPRLAGDLFTNDLTSEEDRLLRTWGFHSLLCFPLRSGRRVVGALQLMSRRSGVLGPTAQDLLAALADELILALQNALAFDRLSTMAMTDELTGLHNRRFCEEFARKQVLAAQRARRQCALLLVDVDHMHEWNERCGQEVGDLLLRDVASTLTGAIRAADLAGRYGGEEFVVVLPNANLVTAQAIAERICSSVRTVSVRCEEQRTEVSVSIGVAAFPECAETLSQLFTSTDVALFAAKEAGRGRVMAAPVLQHPEESD